MDKLVIYSKIESLNRCLKRIRQKTPPTKTVLADDPDIQDIIVLNLERAIQVCVDLAAHIIADLDTEAPQTMSDSFQKLYQVGVITPHTAERMRRAVSFRNIAVHEYQMIDWDIVYSVITKHTDDFKTFAGEILVWIDKNSKN